MKKKFGTALDAENCHIVVTPGRQRIADISKSPFPGDRSLIWIPMQTTAMAWKINPALGKSIEVHRISSDLTIGGANLKRKALSEEDSEIQSSCFDLISWTSVKTQVRDRDTNRNMPRRNHCVQHSSGYISISSRRIFCQICGACTSICVTGMRNTASAGVQFIIGGVGFRNSISMFQCIPFPSGVCRLPAFSCVHYWRDDSDWKFDFTIARQRLESGSVGADQLLANDVKTD